MKKSMIKAIWSKRALAHVVHGAVVTQAFVMGLPEDGVISMGGYDSVGEAKAVAERFEVSLQHH